MLRTTQVSSNGTADHSSNVCQVRQDDCREKGKMIGMNERVQGGKRRERRTPTGDVLKGKKEEAMAGRCQGGKV